MMPTLKKRTLSSTKSRSQSGSVASNDNREEPVISSLRLQIACILATLIAAVIFTLTEHDDHQHTWWCVCEIAMQILLVIIGTAYFRTRVRLFPDTSLLLPPLLMVAAFSLLCEPVQRLFFDHGHSFEVLVMHSQCNLMLALAVCGFRLPFQRLAMLIAVFLTIFSCTISNAKGLVPLTLLLSMACVLWLTLSWWETVDRRLVEHEQRRRPILWIASGVVLPLLLLLPAFGFGSNTVTSALKGFMPSSGGNAGFDPFSRGGVNDGDALVAGNDNIKSFAPLEGAPYLESDKPSLYDVLNDQFDEPPRKIKDQQRAIALPADLMKHIHQQMAEAKQAGREFSLVRGERKADRSRIRDLDSPAAFYVAGQVPARFRMEIYEHFDGVTWYPLDGEETGDGGMQYHNGIREVDGRPWLRISPIGRAFELHEGSMTHSLKVANLEGNVIPSPPALVGVSIEHVDREDMYQVSQHGIVELVRKSVPTMTPINVVSEYAHRERLLDCSNVAISYESSSVTRVLPEVPEVHRVRRLAEKWTCGLPRGWQQIAAIESRLREHCVLDRDAKIAAGSESPVADFLLKTRRGPEYLFAASAACLLRSLDYSSRLVSGFYADPRNYDGRKQHTAVFADNAHFWCEVEIGMKTWVTIEASPGYEIAQPPPGLLGQAWNSILQLGRLAMQNAVAVLLTLTTVMLLVLYRRFVVDFVLTLRWKMASGLTPELRALQLGSLVERRLELAQLRRDSGTTLNRWARRNDLSGVSTQLSRVADIADQAMFGSGGLQLRDQNELEQLAQFLTYRRLRSLNRNQRANVAQTV